MLEIGAERGPGTGRLFLIPILKLCAENFVEHTAKNREYLQKISGIVGPDAAAHGSGELKYLTNYS